MSLNSIIGQPLAVDLLRRWLAKDTTHPLLFYGPAGTGKRTTAEALARALNCPVRPRNGCGQCASCRRITAGAHPDVRVLDLVQQAALRKEPAEKQQVLRIETVLEERRRLLQSALEGPWKVSVIDEAHRLTSEAANVLLKILEEPPPRTAIILATPFRDRLFATILSRCQPVRFRPLTDPEMRQCLGGLGLPAESQIGLIELALGSPGRAVHMSRQEQIQATQEAEALWQALAARGGFDRGRGTRVSRTDVEATIQGLLVPATRSLRAGEARGQRSVPLLQEALLQLRQNVQPALVQDHLMRQLAR